jgi:hypothetical protein
VLQLLIACSIFRHSVRIAGVADFGLLGSSSGNSSTGSGNTTSPSGGNFNSSSNGNSSTTTNSTTGGGDGGGDGGITTGTGNQIEQQPWFWIAVVVAIMYIFSGQQAL